MHHWCYELTDPSLKLDTPQALFERVIAAGRSLGFEYCALGVRLPYPLSNARIELFNNYPVPWQKHYASRRYMEVDPSVAHGRRSSSPGLWNDELFAGVPDLWSEARDAGLRHGWFKSSLETCGAGSMLTLARSAEPLTEAEIESNAEKMSWLAQAVHMAFTKALMPGHLREPESTLTWREVEVLRWTADGKSSGQIADILAISDNTVNFHIKNAIRKLRTTNKTAATVRAAMFGLLNP